jgi:hypothetical protein
MPAPGVGGARQPESSAGYAQPSNPIPERPGARRDASTTGRDEDARATQNGGRN